MEIQAIKNISAVFNVEKPKVKSTEIPSEKLYARIGGLTLENGFLKKKALLICKRQRREMIDFKEKISVSKQCKVLNLSRNLIYYTPKEESGENLGTMLLLDKKYFGVPFYGYRKITVWLQNQGFADNEKRVRRLMELVDWKTISVKGFKNHP